MLDYVLFCRILFKIFTENVSFNYIISVNKYLSSVGNHATGCEMQSTPTTNVVPPATVCSSSVPQLTSNLNNSETLVNSYSFTSNSNNSFWVAGGVGSGSTTLGGLGNSIPCGASVATTSSITVTSSCSTTSASNSHHKWCMPDETRNMPELLNCSDSHNGPWSSTGRLKVKSSIGGVSVQDLSRANIQQIRLSVLYILLCDICFFVCHFS